MMTYIVSYKLFAEGSIIPKDGEMEVQANSEQEAIAKAQETIGLYVMECVEK